MELAPGRLLIADTTLRDGEQSPGAAMTAEIKLQVARSLESLGVDLIEAGYPAASLGEIEAVRSIAAEIRGPIVAALARCCYEDIECALDALEPRDPSRARVHVFLATSPIHREFKLKMTRDEILDRCREAIVLAGSRGMEVQFSLEDATRTELDFVDEVLAAAVEAGAGTICLADTVGGTLPEMYANLFRRASERVPSHVAMAAHCHNDLGLALANSLAACRAGARQVECTLNGIGERAGNTPLEELVMALRVHSDTFRLTTGVNPRRINEASRFLTRVTGLPMAWNKPVVGRNAFTTAAGIHQDGLLKDPETYTLYPPESVGVEPPDIVLSKHSGRAGLRVHLQRLGIALEEKALTGLYKEFLNVADRQVMVSDLDLLNLYRNTIEVATTGADY